MAMSLPRWIGLVAVPLMAAAVWVRADVIVLHNGDRIAGEIVGETDKAVGLRRSTPRGAGRYVEQIERFRIARIERGDHVVATRPAGDPIRGAATRPSSSSPEGPTEADVAMQRSLALAIARWRGEEYNLAGLELSRLINSATPGQLEALSKEAQERCGLSLADLAADAHFRAATTRKTRGIRLSYVTEYEKPALIPRLIEEYESALEAEVTPAEPQAEKVASRDRRRGGGGPETRPSGPVAVAHAASQPAEADEIQPAAEAKSCRIVDWLGRPDDFDGSPELAEALAGQIHYTASLIVERLRLDPEVRRDRMLRADLAEHRSRLMDLARIAVDRAGKAPGNGRRSPELAELERMRREYLEQRARIEKREEMLRLHDAVKFAEQLLQGKPVEAAPGDQKAEPETPENRGPEGEDRP